MVSINLVSTQYKGETCLLHPHATINQNKLNQWLCQLSTSWVDTKGKPFSFLMQQSTCNVNQQLCQSTLSPLDTKGKPVSFALTQQSTKTSLINNCVGWVLLELIQRGNLSPLWCNNQPVMLTYNCVDQPCLHMIWRGNLSPSPSCNNWPKQTWSTIVSVEYYIIWSISNYFTCSPLLLKQWTMTMTIKQILLIEKWACIVQHISQHPHDNQQLLQGQKWKLNFSFHIHHNFHSLWYCVHRLQRYQKPKNLMFNST